MRMNLPNLLTLLRILFVPLLIILFYAPFTWSYKACAILFAIGAITDWFDGFLARRWNQTTRFGAFLDPVADKIIVVTSVCLLVESLHSWWITLPVLIIISRELTVSALREWRAQTGSNADTSVITIAKIKTVIQMVAITVLLYACDSKQEDIRTLGITLLYVSVFFTLLSMFYYMKTSWSHLNTKL